MERKEMDKRKKKESVVASVASKKFEDEDDEEEGYGDQIYKEEEKSFGLSTPSTTQASLLGPVSSASSDLTFFDDLLNLQSSEGFWPPTPVLLTRL